MDATFFLLLAIAIIGVLIFIGITVASHKNYSFNVEEYQTRWLKIENSLERDDTRSYQMTVMEADKLLDHALREMNLPGNTMGERMKKVDDKFTNANHVWWAHKLRNQLAHEQDFNIDYNEASRALNAFRQALKDLGAI